MGARAGEWVILAGAEGDGELTRGVWKARGDSGWPEFELELVRAVGGSGLIPSILGAERVGRERGKRGEMLAFNQAWSRRD